MCISLCAVETNLIVCTIMLVSGSDYHDWSTYAYLHEICEDVTFGKLARPS